ncbi:Hsp70 family protein [Hellea balneolensis]|uniref:Hsp70 family protein n=1 Tax=Hellea balneolensis TaxID=287478 RepID=UPI0004274368|nr:Hsp70 family protein [Hellea balneolensis]
MNKASSDEFIGFDLGHGETALGRAFGATIREPEILEYRGERSFVTAIAKAKGEVKIGADAVNLSFMGDAPEIWVKFKGRDLNRSEIKTPTQLFTKTLIGGLAKDGIIRGPKESRFIVGCPSGWENETRQGYQKLFEGAGLKTVRIVPESRAALMTALEQGYLSIEDARSSVLIIDIGSSTTDFTYCRDMDAEDVGHNILGSGLLDTEIFKLNLARQKSRKQIEKLITRYPHYQPIMEYWCRLAKEQYFTGQETPVEMIKRLPINGGVLFEIRMDKEDAKAILNNPLEALNGYSWQTAFDYALSETIENLGGRAPDTVLLTGGASRLPLVLPATKKIFPKAKVVRGAEPEFSIARGLAWLGRFEFLHASFQKSVADMLSGEGAIYTKARKASVALGKQMAPVLVDAMADNCIVPVFQDWRSGKIKSLDEVEGVLSGRVKTWLQSESAAAVLKPVIGHWFADLQRDIERETDPLCRDHGLPAMVLSLDDSQHISRHLEDLSVSAPKVNTMESDTALVGTTLTALIVSALLAKANLFAPLLLNPIGLVVGGAVAGGSFIYGRKALEGRFKGANVPVIARQIMTDGRIKRAAAKQRPDLIQVVDEAWQQAAADRFTDELTETLKSALTERADERAMLFLI